MTQTFKTSYLGANIWSLGPSRQSEKPEGDVNLPDCYSMTLLWLDKHLWERQLVFWRTIGEIRKLNICDFVCWSLSQNLTPLFPPRTPRFSILGGVKTLNFCPKMVSLGDFTFCLSKPLWSRNLTPLSLPRTHRFSILGWVKSMNFF